MTNILRSKYKASRRLGVSIWGSAKDSYNKKNYRPGQHGVEAAGGRPSDYGLHLQAKQRLKAHYGRVNERQFRNMFAEADRMRGNTGDNFIGLLERRLDSVVYRMTAAPTIFAARQMVSHKLIKVNGRKVNIPSYQVRVGDVVELVDSAKQMVNVTTSVQSRSRPVPDYIAFDENDISAKLSRIPTEADVPYPFEANVHLVVEYYSR